MKLMMRKSIVIGDSRRGIIFMAHSGNSCRWFGDIKKESTDFPWLGNIFDFFYETKKAEKYNIKFVEKKKERFR